MEQIPTPALQRNFPTPCIEEPDPGEEGPCSSTRPTYYARPAPRAIEALGLSGKRFSVVALQAVGTSRDCPGSCVPGLSPLCPIGETDGTLKRVIMQPKNRNENNEQGLRDMLASAKFIRYVEQTQQKKQGRKTSKDILTETS